MGNIKFAWFVSWKSDDLILSIFPDPFRSSPMNIYIRSTKTFWFDKVASMLYLNGHFLVKIHVINRNIRRLIAVLSNGRRPLRFKLDQHRHIHINYTCLNRIWPFNGNGSAVSPLTWTFHRLNHRNDDCLYYILIPKFDYHFFDFSFSPLDLYSKENIVMYVAILKWSTISILLPIYTRRTIAFQEAAWHCLSPSFN